MNALFQAVYNHYMSSTGHGAYTSVSGRFYHNQAPQNVSFPYIVYFEVSDVDQLDFSDELEDITLQFNIFSQNFSALEAGQILENVKSLFDSCSLTVTNWRHLEMRRTNIYVNDSYDQDPPIHGYSVEYDVLLEKAR